MRVASTRRGPVRVRALADPGPDAAGRRLVWLASGEEGFPLGAAFLRLPDRDGRREPGELDVEVHPAERRRGVGSLLLEAAVEAARRDGRGAVVAEARTASAGSRGSAGTSGPVGPGVSAGSVGGAAVGAVADGGPVGAVPGAGVGDAGFVEAGGGSPAGAERGAAAAGAGLVDAKTGPRRGAEPGSAARGASAVDAVSAGAGPLGADEPGGRVASGAGASGGSGAGGGPAAGEEAGERFLLAHGFRSVLAMTYARLDLARPGAPGADRPRGAVGAGAWGELEELVRAGRPGYRLVSWDGAVPEELVDGYVASRRAMDDMPMGETGQGPVAWDAARLRTAARAVAARGDLLHTVVAVDEADGSIAGFTELVVPGDGAGDGQHYGTAVLPEHRGRGLGLWMKAESILRARARHPRLEGLVTDTADVNAPMRAINDRLGFESTHRSVHFRLDL